MFGTGFLAPYPRMVRATDIVLKRAYRVWKRLYIARYGWHRAAIGGRWERMGPAQLEFMKSVGLKPHHTLLDVGCGSLRGGVCFIPYLDKGNYYAIEKEASLIEAAREKEIPRYKLHDKAPNLYLIDDFDISRIGVKFDFMFSHSVFSHLRPEQIEKCLDNVLPWLKPTGAFYVDFVEGDEIALSRPHRWRRAELSKARYPRSFFEELAARKGYDMTYIGEWPNPTEDRMLKFGCLSSRGERRT